MGCMVHQFIASELGGGVAATPEGVEIYYS